MARLKEGYIKIQSDRYGSRIHIRIPAKYAQRLGWHKGDVLRSEMTYDGGVKYHKEQVKK